MRRESLVFAISGTFFGVLVGWMLGGLNEPERGAPSAQAAPAGEAATAAPRPSLDATRVASLEAQAGREPASAGVRIELGNLFMDAERFDAAIRWYEAALALDPKNVDVSTDLGVCFYSTNQVDRALAQFETSLALDPGHTKTLLNQGIVRAFGKQDLAGASASWTRLVAMAPSSAEGQRARQLLDGLAGAHPGVAPGRGK
jgi:tetratricopeptide (TPR) repeat protein